MTLQRASQEVKEAQMFREKMGHVSEWMARAQLPRNVKEKIRAYYTEVCSQVYSRAEAAAAPLLSSHSRECYTVQNKLNCTK